MKRKDAKDNSGGDENISVNKIDIRKGLSKPIVIYLMAALFVLVMAFYMDITGEYKAKLYHCFFLLNKCMDKNLVLYGSCRHVRDVLMADLDAFLSVILTLGTILAAAVIFFYSVQDSKKEGIPHRAIMSYTSGSFSVPFLFIIVMIMLPLNYVSCSLELHWFTTLGLIFTFITQMIIILIILMSTSHQYSLYAISNAEIRQYQALCTIRKMQDRNGTGDRNTPEKVNQNSLFIWTYLLNHLEQVFLSEELISDKMELARRLLRVPFYERQIRMRDEMFWRLKEKMRKAKAISVKPLISEERMKDNHLRAIYEFYYRNLIVVFRNINQPQDKEERSKIYLILYEFMEELTEQYEKMGRDEEGIYEKGRLYYSMAVCGMINAVMDSNSEDSEYFCNYVFNNIVSSETWYFHICLYILFQEFLYRTNTDAVKLDNLQGIDNLKNWEVDRLTPKEKDMCGEFWEIWAESTTLSEDMGYYYFFWAFGTLLGELNKSEPIMRFRQVLKQMKE